MSDTMQDVAGELTPAQPALDPSTEDTTAAQTAGAEPEQQEPKEERKFTQAELDEAIRKRLARETRRRIEAETRLKIAPPPEAPKPAALADFNGDPEAFARHVAQQATQQARQQWEAEQREAQSRQQAAKVEVEFTKRAQSFAKDTPDFEEIAYGIHWQPSSEMVDYIKESDIGPQIAYHLGKNTEEAERIADMNPRAQARELARLEAKLATQPKPVASRAPEPIAPVGARSSAPRGLADDLPIDEWMRRERERARRR